MNELDSRYLRPGDTFAQRFTKAGTYHYNIGITGSLATAGHDAPFTLTVTAKAGAAPQTHYVTVDYTNGNFTAAPKQLQINEGDAVLWSSTAAAAPGFSVYGQSKDERFDSAEIHGHVRRRNSKITVGQTVFFAVKSAAGISIVDKNLVASASALNPQPLPP